MGTIHSRIPLHILASFSMTSFTCLSAGSSELSAENCSSGSNLVEVRKKKCGELFGGTPPG